MTRVFSQMSLGADPSTNKKIVIIGAYGIIGRECQRFFLTSKEWKSSSFQLVGRGDEIQPSLHQTDIIINCSSAVGNDLKYVVRSVNREVRFYHISSQAIGNGTEYGINKLSDERYIQGHFKNNKIIRLGVPCRSENGQVIGLGYWSTVKLSTYKPFIISFCNVSLHDSQEIFESLLSGSEPPLIGRYLRLPFGKYLRKFIPFRKLNSILSRFNFVVVG